MGDAPPLHPYYSLLPSYVSTDTILSEREDFVTRVRESLTVLERLRVEGEHASLQKKHFRNIETLFKLKHALPKQVHQQLIDVLVWLLWTNDALRIVDVDMEVRAVHTLRLLLKKWKSRYPPSEASELRLSWRQAKQAIDRVCFSSHGNARVANPSTLQMLASGMVSCVEKARPFFGSGDDGCLAEELWREFGPVINDIKSNRCFQALGYFTMLVNISMDATDREWLAISTFVPQWLKSWSLIARCANWDGHWFKLFARIAKRFPLQLAASLRDATRFVFAKVHDLLNLPSDLGSPFKNNARPSAYSILDGTKRYDQQSMRLCAYLLANPNEAGVPDPVNQHIVKILTTLKPYFHPSNASSAAGSLINTVYFLGSAIAQRLGRERASSTVYLNVESCREVFESLLQLSFYGIYSKNRSIASRCMYVLKSLVCIDPSYCARPILEEMVKALDPSALSQSHMAPAAISSLSVFLYHLMCGQGPKGPGLLFSTYLAPLLRLTLPGIDVNDDTKTVTTLRFYFFVLSWLPLVNDVEKKGDGSLLGRIDVSNELFKEMEVNTFAAIDPNGPEVDLKMWELGSFLEEWSLALLDRCLEFFRTRANTQSHDSASKGSSDSSEHAQREDAVVMEVLDVMSLLYGQMSPSLYSQALRKTVAFVSGSFFTSEFGGKVISSLVFNCVQGNFQEATPLFLRVALDKLHVSKLKALMTNEKVWYLHILNGAVRANDSTGSTLLAYREELRVVLAHYLIHEEDKEVYEAAGIVLEDLLHALAGVYPLDFRSLPPQEWATATSASTNMFQFLGAAVSWKRLNVQWHEPNEQELAFAQDLLQDHLVDTFTTLGKLRASGDVNVRDWIPHLKRVYVSVRGARNLLVDTTRGPSALQAGSLPMLVRGCGANSTLLDSLVSLKARVLSDIHAIVGHWQVHGQKGVTENLIWKVLLKVMKQLLVWRGSHLGNHRSKEKQNLYIKMMTTDVASKQLRKSRRFDQDPLEIVPLSSRNEMVERVLFFYSKRRVQEHFEMAQFVLEDGVSGRDQYEALLLDVDELTKHAYEEVRNGASAVMRDSYEIFVKWIYARISDHLDILEGKIVDDKGYVKEEAVSGALEFLRRSRVLAYLRKSRDALLERALTAVLASNDVVMKKVETEASKAKMSVKIQTFFLSLMASWRYVREISSKKLVTALLAAEPPSSEHWKQQLMHLVCFFPLLQPKEVPLSTRLWQLVIRRLEHDVLPVRQVAMLLLSQLVKLEKWNASATGAYNTDVSSLLFSEATLKLLVTSMVENHRNSHRFAASADGQHANSAPSDWSFGVNEVIRSLSNTANAYPKPPPLSSIRLLNQTSDALKSLNMTHVKLVQRLTRINPRGILQSGMLATLEDLTSRIDSKVSDEDRQASLSTLGEWTSGMLRSVLKLPSEEDAFATSAVSSITDLVKKVLSNINLAVVEPWTQALYYVSRPANTSSAELQLARLDAVVLYVLGDFEASFARATVDDYADQVKWMSLLEPLLVHLLGSDSKRLATVQSSIRSSVVGVMDAHALAHRYKMVRDRAAKILYILEANDDDTGSDSRPTTVLLNKVVGLSQVNSTNADDNNEGEIVLNAKETAMQWLVCAERHGEPRDFARIMKPLFPIVFLSQNHSKVEIALLAKNTANAISLSLRLYAPPSDAEASTHLDELIEMLEQLATHDLWKTRAGVLRFLTLFTFYHWLFFTREQQERIQQLVMKFLADEQREIQDMAKYALRSLAHIQRPAVVSALSRQLTEAAKDARVKHPKLVRRLQKQQEDEPDDTDELKKTRSRIKTNEDKMATSILGMSAIVLAFPYSVPDFVPPLFEEMGRYMYIKHSTPTVSYLEKSVKDTLLEFKRTHQDSWLEIKNNFTQQQRDVFEDVVISPSYYT